MIAFRRPLATVFIGSVHYGQTQYVITHGGEWFNRCDEAGRATEPVKFNACNVHLLKTSRYAINAGLTALEQAQLITLQEYLEAYSGEHGFSIDCYFELLYLRIGKRLDISSFEEVCKALGVYPQSVFDMTAQKVTNEVVEALRARSLMSEDGARALLECLSR